MLIRKRIARRAGTPRKAGVAGKVVYAIAKDEMFASSILAKAGPPVSRFREGEYLHVSDLIGKCVRQIALSSEHESPMPAQYISHSMGMTFAQGTAIHDYIKERLSERCRDTLFGTWSCNCGDLRIEEVVRSKVPEEACGRCGVVAHKYHELELHHQKLMVVGSPDIVFHVARGNFYYPVELKSISHDQWKDLVRPKADHVIQILFYWYLMRELGYAVSGVVSIVYATKGFIFKGSPFKEFTLDAMESLPLLDDFLEDAAALVAYFKNGTLPPRVQCTSRNCTQAKSCHVAQECFR